MSKLYTCTICNKKKQPNEFYLRKNGGVGEYKCKLCLKKKRKNYYDENYEEVRKCNRKAVSEFQKRNPAKTTAKTIAYYMKKNQSLPKWISKDDISKMRSIYKMCRNISKKTGIPHEVDHIVPINGENVCGLHVPWNLRVIPRDENKKKSNSLIEEIVCSTSKDVANT